MRTEDRPRLRRAALALLGVAMAVAAVVLFAVGPGGDDAPSGGTVPEAGSKFREGQGDPEQNLIQALAPVLSGPGGPGGTKALPVDRAVAQLMLVGFEGDRSSRGLNRRLTARDWGGLWVTEGNFRSPGALAGLVQSAQRAARKAGHVQPLVVTDPTVLPIGPQPQVELGPDATQDEVRADTQRAGRRLDEAGIDLVLAPSADLGIGGGPAENRSFSDDPLLVAPLVRAAVQGYDRGGVGAAPGRFPGEGGASQDPLEGPATVGLGLDELVARDLRPFAAAAELAPAMQMSAALYAAWDGVTPATLLPDAVRLLRERLGFRGAVISADLISATAATGESVGRAAVEALRAGCDVLLVPGGEAEAEEVVRAVVDAVERRQLPRERLDEAVAGAAALRKRAQDPS